MIIRDIFQDDINRKINGVVKVDQNTDDVIVQELEEYVITKELKKHFVKFFSIYADSLENVESNIGVWISGFFGSGKSHFLKMLSYLLRNNTVQGVKSVERFRRKFADDPLTFAMIENTTKTETDTILFNIDIEGSINKDETAVLRVFYKMFYNHLGFYGEDLKIAKLEQFVAKQGKTEEFRNVFEELNGQPWVEARDSYAFFEDDIEQTLVQVLGMSETAAQNWFNGSEGIETSIAQLVSEIKDYVKTKPKNYRLLFMADEVGQYVGANTSLLLNLQSLVEKIGSECGGQVWVICTGQEAIDEIIKARENEFSRIQARFKTRLSLSSSSADEVIQKRILSKKPEAEKELESIYGKQEAVLRNIFSFKDAVLDIKGYKSDRDFAVNYPFVPYQFIIMQKVFSEIRKHGNSGKHLSGGERSMLSGFQEAAQKIQTMDENALAPFYLFYDTVHTFLEGAIRRVIDRCARAADDGNGIEKDDVNVLKLLYLIRYVDDIPANLDNIVILMADDIRIDKINMRAKIQESLDRLMKQNYIGRNGDTYKFLTDEEQDIMIEIKNMVVDTSSITEKISNIIYGDIYTSRKYKYNKYDFPFTQMIDTTTVGMAAGSMTMRILTAASDETEKDSFRLGNSSGGQVVIVLEDDKYYEYIESAMKIRKFVKQKNVAQLAKPIQDIIRGHQDQADKYETEASDSLKKAIVNARIFIDGEQVSIPGTDAKKKMDQALQYLVERVYTGLDKITCYFENDADIIKILSGNSPLLNDDEKLDPNYEAYKEILSYLEMQHTMNMPTSMFDIQRRYQDKPYGWREVDIASVMARLIVADKVDVKYGGMQINADNSRLVDMLRKKTETGKTLVSKHITLDPRKVKEVREFMRDYFDIMDISMKESEMVHEIIGHFDDRKKQYESYLKKYEGHRYPDKAVVSSAAEELKKVLEQQKDNIALVNYIYDHQDDLYDVSDKMRNIEEFFKSKVQIFDSAVSLEHDLRDDLDFIKADEKANEALNKIRLITMCEGKFDYRKIPELNGLMDTVNASHDGMLEEKRKEVRSTISQCIMAIRQNVTNEVKTLGIIDEADRFYDGEKEKLDDMRCMALMDGMLPRIWQKKDDFCRRIEIAQTPVPVTPEVEKQDAPKKLRSVQRMAIFQAKTLTNEEEIDAYLESVKKSMMNMLNGHDGIKLD